MPYTLLPYSSAQLRARLTTKSPRGGKLRGKEERKRGDGKKQMSVSAEEGKAREGTVLLEKCHQQEIKRQLNGVPPPPPPPLTGRDLTGEEIDSREEEEQTARTWGGR